MSSSRNQEVDWDELVEELHPAIYRYCLHLLHHRSSADAADATQESFLKALKAAHRPATIAEARLWMFSIARNVCIDQMRWWKRAGSFLFSSGTAERPETDRADVLRLMLRESLKKLSSRQYEVFILRHWHGFSTEETATLLALDSGSVKSHLKRAVDHLRKDFVDLELSDNQSGAARVEEV